MTSPLVSVAVPLCRSSRFLPHIVRNLETLDYPNLELIVSDRHCEDEALATLRHRFGSDARFQFIARTDRVGWVAHYNDLLDVASGDYMMWLPHDDSIPSGYVTRLVECLEAHTDAVLAFGRIEGVDVSGSPLDMAFAAPPFAGRSGWTLRSSIELLFWGAGIPVRGVFRRRQALRSTARLLDTLDSVGADSYWVFGLSLAGRLHYDPWTTYVKRYHAGSASAVARPRLAHAVDGARVLARYVREARIDRRSRLAALAGIAGWSVAWTVRRATTYLAPPVRRGVRRALVRAVPRVLLPGMGGS